MAVLRDSTATPTIAYFTDSRLGAGARSAPLLRDGAFDSAEGWWLKAESPRIHRGCRRAQRASTRRGAFDSADR